jgi:WD40 repeat protein
MSAPDRRTFLQAAGQLAAGIAAADAGAVFAQDPPKDVNAPLLPLDGDGKLSVPAGALRRLGDPRMRILGSIKALQFSPKGTTLVSAAAGELRGWDPRSGKVLFRLNFPNEASVDSGRLTSRDTFVLLVRPHAGNSQEFRKYAFGTGRLVSRSPGLKFQNAQRTAYAPDGTRMAAIHSGALAVHDTATGDEKWREPVSSEQVTDAYFFPDGTIVAVATKGEVKLIAAATGKPAGTLSAPAASDGRKGAGRGDRARDHVSDLAASADGKWLAASVGEDEDVVLCWDVKAASVKLRLEPAGKPLGFNPGGSELATVYAGLVTFWATASGKALRQFPVPTGDLYLSPDGKMIAAECGDAAVLIDTATGKPLPHSADPPGNPSELRFVGANRLQGRLSPWGGWVEWDLTTGQHTLLRPPGVTGRTPLTLTTDSRMALYHHAGEYTAYALATGHPFRSVKLADDDNDRVRTLAMTPDGRAFVRSTDDGIAVITQTGRRVIPRGGESVGLPSVVATDGRTAAVGYRGTEGGSQIDLYDLAAGRHVRAIRLDGEAGRTVFSPDGSRVVVAHDNSGDGRRGRQTATTIFDVQTGKAIVRTEPTEDDFDQTFALSLDGRMLARLGSGGQVRIWDIAAGQIRFVIEVGKDADLNAVAFSPDGRTVAVSVNGGPVFLWDLYPRTPVRLSVDDLECAWLELQSGDAAAAFKAVRLLARASAQAIAFLGSRIRPLDRPDPEAVARHIADLDHKEFRKRETAARSLAELGERARDAMTRALNSGPSPETRDRLERLLAADEKPTADQLRRLRAVEIVEIIGSPEAGAVLAHWAAGAPGARMSLEARAAANRVDERLKQVGMTRTPGR